jgi:hypothetical protein
MIINQFQQRNIKCNKLDRIISDSDNSAFGLDQIRLTKILDLEDEKSTITDCSSEDAKDNYSSDESDYQHTKKTKIIEVLNSKMYFLKNSKSKRDYLKNKNIITEKKENTYFVGGTVSEFNKDSPFINMLINRRIRFCDLGPSCHIAAFVPDLGIENKFSNWAFGKFAIGENSERFRYGNTRLSTHAEMDALKKLDNLIRVQKCKKQKMDLVVIRINKSGNLCESAPCYHCTRELQNSKVITINKLYFSRWDGTITCIKFSEWVKNDTFHISKGWRWMAHTCYSK